MTTHDIAALCAAIDDGHDDALGPLADALEQAGLWRGKHPQRQLNLGFGWWSGPDDEPERNISRLGWDLPALIRLRCRHLWTGWEGYAWAIYPSRHAAYLALAEAITE